MSHPTRGHKGAVVVLIALAAVLLMCAAIFFAARMGAEGFGRPDEGEAVGGWWDTMHRSTGTVLAGDEDERLVTIEVEEDNAAYEAGSIVEYDFSVDGDFAVPEDISWVEVGMRVTVDYLPSDPPGSTGGRVDSPFHIWQAED